MKLNSCHKNNWPFCLAMLSLHNGSINVIDCEQRIHQHQAPFNIEQLLEIT